jgi:exodeoxyribonuclease VII large subunit
MPDLFGPSNASSSSAAAGDEAISVSALTHRVRERLESSPQLQRVRVQGELSNFSRPRSGHVYFTLKDEHTQLAGVMFRSQAERHNIDSFQTGDTVIAKGDVRVYEPRGQYQIQVSKLEHAGQGELYQRFLALKAKLASAGLFQEANKQALVPHPSCIAVISSPSGAVIHDILNTLRRRAPALEVVLIPAAVQGQEAVPSLRQALQWAQRWPGIQQVILARGGGSMEDLWAFNDEQLAYELFALPFPLISAIGHETDFTIADFVADVRAPTPTAAAELAAPHRAELRNELLNLRRTLGGRIQYRVEHQQQQLDELRLRLRGPMDRLLAQRLRQLGQLSHRLFSPTSQRIAAQRQTLAYRRQRLDYAARSRLQHQQHTLSRLQDRLHQLHPEEILRRGYTLTLREGKIVRRAQDLQPGQQLETRFRDGSAFSAISRIEPDPTDPEAE